MAKSTSGKTTARKIVLSYLARRKTPATSAQIVNGTTNVSPHSETTILREIHFLRTEGKVRNVATVTGKGSKGLYELVR